MCGYLRTFTRCNTHNELRMDTPLPLCQTSHCSLVEPSPERDDERGWGLENCATQPWYEPS